MFLIKTTTMVKEVKHSFITPPWGYCLDDDVFSYKYEYLCLMHSSVHVHPFKVFSGGYKNVRIV